MKVLIYGSTYLSQKVCEHLLSNPVNDCELVGYIPSPNPTIKGIISLPKVSIKNLIAHDIGLNVGYERYIRNHKKVFNVHPGLLPEYGGVDILHHTIVNKATYQGFTLQKMIDKIDEGPILSQYSYRVFPTDDVISLYNRNLIIYPCFVRSCLLILNSINLSEVDLMPRIEPNIYYRGQIDPKHKSMYQSNYLKLKEIEKANLKCQKF